MSSVDELRQWGLARDSLRTMNQTVLDTSGTDTSRIDTSGAEEDKAIMALTPYSELPTLTGLVPNRPLDLFIKGTIMSGQARSMVAQQQAELGRVAAEKIGTSIEEHGADYTNAMLANALGAPVDVANTLLSLLGIEMSDKPFMGARNIKQALDKLSGISHSERYLIAK